MQYLSIEVFTGRPGSYLGTWYIRGHPVAGCDAGRTFLAVGLDFNLPQASGPGAWTSKSVARDS